MAEASEEKKDQEEGDRVRVGSLLNRVARLRAIPGARHRQLVVKTEEAMMTVRAEAAKKPPTKHAGGYEYRTNQGYCRDWQLLGYISPITSTKTQPRLHAPKTPLDQPIDTAWLVLRW